MEEKEITDAAVGESEIDGEAEVSALSEAATEELRRTLEEITRAIGRALELLNAGGADPRQLSEHLTLAQSAAESLARPVSGQVLEGVFSGEAMVGADGKRYNIPPNYASKSKLVEGDLLKLTITSNGSFIYKQIGPIDREQLVGLLARDQLGGNWYAVKGDRRWRVLTASVTYYHGKPGDQAVILIPKNSRSNWAAVENIIAV